MSIGESSVGHGRHVRAAIATLIRGSRAAAERAARWAFQISQNLVDAPFFSRSQEAKFASGAFIFHRPEPMMKPR
jgi:hypothetical protein